MPGLRSVASGGETLGAEMLDWGRRAFGLTINEFYGQTECNMVASSAGSLFPPRPGAIGKAVKSGEPTRLEHRAVHKSGETVWVECTFKALRDEHGHVDDVVVVAEGELGVPTWNFGW